MAEYSSKKESAVRPDQRVLFKYELENYKECMLNADFVSVMPDVEKLDCAPEDILLCSFPKSGTTWTDTVLGLMLHNGDDEQRKAHLVPPSGETFIHMEARYSNTPDGDFVMLNSIKSTPHPRYLWSHLPYDLLPQSAINNRCKIVYIYRNVKDVLVSYYHFHLSNWAKLVDNLGDIEDFAERFMKDRLAYCPYFASLHSYWVRRHDSNIFVFSYEQMKKDHVGMIRKLAEFLGKTLTEEQVELVRYHSSFEVMRKTQQREYCLFKDENGNIVHQFFRSGTAGSWKDELSPALNNKIDNWIAENLQKYGFDRDPFEDV